jgi:hypothetical protein
MPESLDIQYRKIIESLQKGNGLTPENISKLVRFQRSNPQFIPAADMTAQLQQLQQDWMNDPKYKDLLDQAQRKQKSDKIAAEVAPFMQAVLAGTDIGTALSQVKSARRAGLGLRRPVRPTMGRSQELQSAIDDARMRANQVDPNVMNSLKLNNLDSYMADLQNAKTASGGQAGLYGSLAQAAINRRNRANLASAPLAQQMLAQNRARYDSLLGQQQQEQARLNQNSLYQYNVDLGQYNNEAQAIGALESRGRSNTRNALYNMSNLAPNLIGRLSTMRSPIIQGAQPRFKPDTYELGPENQAYLDALQGSTVQGLYNPESVSKWNYNINYGNIG